MKKLYKVKKLADIFILIAFITFLFQPSSVISQNNCCFEEGGIPVGSGWSANVNNLSDLLSHSAFNPTYITNQDLYVCGTFFIDVDYQFINVKIFMEEEAQIVIQQGSRFVMSNSIVTACSGLHKGFLLKSQSELTSNGSQYYDAHKAIETEFNSNLFLYGNIIENNETGVHIVGTINGIFIKNEFTNNSDYGIRINGAFQNIGLLSSLSPILNPSIRNIFMQNGTAIYSDNLSLIDVQNNLILGLTNSSTQSQIGRGIYVRKGHLNAYKNDMLFLENAIEVGSQASAYIDDNEFGKCEVGILTNTQDESVEVMNNNMSLMTTGFEATGSLGGKIVINDNTIESSSLIKSTAGIKLISGLIGVVGDFKILNNQINIISNGQTTTSFAGDGVVNSGFHTLNILKNSIILSGYQGTGIQNSDADFVNIKENSITGNGTSTRKRGFVNTFTEEVTFCCNSGESLREIMLFNGDCDRTILSTTYMGTSARGIHIKQHSIIGLQPYRGNLWGGSYSFKAARNENDSPADKVFLDMSKFDVNNNIQPVHPFDVHPPTGWFFDNLTGTHFPCALTNCLSPSNIYANSPSELEIAMAKDSVSILGEGYNWYIQQGLYDRIVNNSSLLGNNTDVDNWYVQAQNGIVKDYYDIKNSIHSLFENSAIDSTYLSDLKNQMQVISGQIYSLDDVIAQLPVEQWTTYANQRYQLVEGIDSLINLFELKHDIIMSNRIVNAQSLVNSNSVLSTPDVPSVNEKMVNDIFLHTLAQNIDTFSTIQQSQLLSIANQCIDDGGRAVYQARNLYYLIDNSISFEDSIICNSGQGMKRKATKKMTKSDILVQPNPVNGVLIVKTELFDDEQYSLKIYTINGNMLFQIKGWQGEEVSTAQLPNGMYLLELEGSGGENVKASKFVVQH